MYKTQKFPKTLKYLVTCPCCDTARFSIGVLEMLLWAEQFGEVFVTSFFRCHNYNKSVGGKIGSFHTKGRAVDFFIPQVSVRELYDKLNEKFPDSCGLGLYLKNGFVHFDDRLNKARWNG